MPVTKTEGGVDYQASDYADVADPQTPGTWKLRLAEGGSGKFTVAQVGRAITALQPGGFRGNKVELGTAKGTVISKINTAIGKTPGDDTQKGNLRDRLNGVKAYAIKALEHGHAEGEKCDMCGPSPVSYGEPYGGAQSFAELDQWAATQAASEEFSEITDQFRLLMFNIMNDADLEIPQKAAAAKSLAAEFQNIIQNPIVDDEDVDESIEDDTEDFEDLTDDDDDDEKAKAVGVKVGKRISGTQLGTLRKAHDMIKSVLSFGQYDDKKATALTDKPVKRALGKAPVAGLKAADCPTCKGKGTIMAGNRKCPDCGGTGELKAKALAIDLTGPSGFKAYKDTNGDLRWIAYSSNAFEDLDKELFKTKALEEAVNYADKAGERGPLLLYHVDPAVIGSCDWQGMAGRFLIESGTFSDDKMGQKAAQYFLTTPDEHQVSIGYKFEPGDDADGVYEWLRIRERSVTPKNAAANPWTEFGLIGGKEMDAKKKAFLDKVVGPEIAGSIVAQAEAKTKDLEDAGIRFKEKADAPDAELVSSIKALEDSLSGLTGEGADAVNKALADLRAKAGIKEAASEASSPDNALILAAIEGLGQRVVGLTAEIAAVKTGQASLETEVKALKVSDDAKIAGKMAPRLQIVTGNRPSESPGNVIDEEKGKELTGAGDDDNPANPAAGYVQDLLRNVNLG